MPGNAGSLGNKMEELDGAGCETIEGITHTTHVRLGGS